MASSLDWQPGWLTPASLRFDLRGHSDSEGCQEDLTIAGVLTDIRAASGLIRSQIGVECVALLGTSFSGGICGYYATQHPAELASLVMLNPLLNYRKRFIDDKPYWHNGHISEEAGRELMNHGYLAHSPTFKLGRSLLNKIFYLRPHTVLEDIQVPTLIVHGTNDTFIPVESSRWAVQRSPSSITSWRSRALSTVLQSTTIRATSIHRVSNGKPRSFVPWLVGSAVTRAAIPDSRNLCTAGCDVSPAG